jgi:hypothetical protein
MPPDIVIVDEAARQGRRRMFIGCIALRARHAGRVARARVRTSPRSILVDLANPPTIVAARARHSALRSFRFPQWCGFREVSNDGGGGLSNNRLNGSLSAPIRKVDVLGRLSVAAR